MRDELAEAQDVVVTGSRLPPAAVMPPPPIRVDLSPAPVKTEARLLVTFALVR
jgi:hypothetical protein